MANKSSYLNYLPPVLWEKDPAPPAFSLGAMLRIFEKILSGINDGVVVTHSFLDSEGQLVSHQHRGVEEEINRLHRLFNPWTSPKEFLPWLASWLGLEFSALWDEYSRRKITSQISGIYLMRGLKTGLETYLDLYTVAATRPRIAVDDGSRILFAQPQPSRFAFLTSLISHGPSVRFDSTAGNWSQTHEGIVMPSCMTMGADGSLIVGDQGTPMTGIWSPIVDEGLWRIMPPGRYPFSGTPPHPRRLGPAAWNLIFPVAIAADAPPAPPAPPPPVWNIYLLDRVIPGATNALYRLSAPGFASAAALATKSQLGTVWPVAMARDSNGHLLILDRGTPAPSGSAAAPRVIDVDVSVSPVVVSWRNLTLPLEPLSLVVRANGDLIIGDGGNQTTAVPGDLIRVDRSNAMAWVESSILGGVPVGSNPLAAPLALADEDSNHLFVADVGLKPLFPALANPFERIIADPAAIYRVDLGPVPPTLIRATEKSGLVYPTGMVWESGTLYVCDRGEYSDPGLAGALPAVWRARSHEFGVVVHFSSQRQTTQRERRQIVNDIAQVIAGEKPAHAIATFVYAV